MNRLLFIIGFLIVLMPAFSREVRAQGTFGCEWRGFTCSLDYESETCDRERGYEMEADYCQRYNLEGLCNSAGPFDCVCDDPNAPCFNEAQLPSGLVCEEGGGISTAIGCISIDNIEDISRFALTLGVAIGGGIAFLLIIYAGFMITTSTGNPERLKAGQELLTSAIAGIILIVFSVFLLRVLGVDILGLPGFGG